MPSSHEASAKPAQAALSQSNQSGLEQSAAEVAASAQPNFTFDHNDNHAQQPHVLSTANIAYLQRAAGNRAVAGLLQRQANLAAPSLIVQPKLIVGPAQDRYEQEADRIADQVVGRPPIAASSTSSVQRTEDENAYLAKSVTQLPAVKTSAASVHRQAEQAHDSQAGFNLESQLERKIRASSGGNPLKQQTRSFMESRFGADFSSVRVHTGNESSRLNRQIDAKAFTHRNHIYFGDNSSSNDKHLLAHELTHVVQQGAAGSSNAGPSVQRAPAGGLIQRKGIGSWLKSKFSKKKATAPTGPTTDAPTTNAPTTTDPSKTSAPSSSGAQLADSVEYETRLGRYAYNHSKTTAATKSMLDKMIKVTIGDLDKIDDSDDKTRGDITSTFGSDKDSSAGQVGVKFEPVLEVLKQGNLREQLTALMNAMFGPFKNYLAQALKKGRWAELEAKGLNVEKMKRRKRQMALTPGAGDLYRNPYLKYDRKNAKSYEDFGGKMRTEVKGPSGRTADDLGKGDNPVGLSSREQELQFPGKKDDEIGSEKLKWIEGATNWQINDNNPWVKQAKTSLKMPVVAGPSGTMTRMLQLWEWLNKPAPVNDWRLAVLAWMLTSNDHTFHEMMLAAVDYGLPYTPGQQAYMNVAPLTVNELRTKVAKDGLFPHEHAFKRRFDSGSFKTIMDEDAFDDAEYDLEDKKTSEAGALSSPAAAAVKLYTSFGYLILNPVLRGGPEAEAQILKAINEKDELDDFKDKLDDGTLDIKQLIAEARELVPMLESALTMLPDWSGHVYRGAAYDTTWVYRGKTFTFDKVGSTSKNEDTAKDFAQNFNKGKYKYILEMDVTAGKDLSKVSEVKSEDEIVLPPGSGFTITKRTKPTSADPFYRVFMTQTKRGGDLLDLGERPTMASAISISGASSLEDDSETEEEEEDKISLLIYDHVGDEDAYTAIAADQEYMIDDLGAVEDEDGWSEVSYVMESGTFYTKTEDLKIFLNQNKPKAKAKPITPVVKKKLDLHMNVIDDVGYSSFPLSDPSEIISYTPHPYEKGWSNVSIQDESGPLTYYGRTDEVMDFLGIVAPVDDTADKSEPVVVAKDESIHESTEEETVVDTDEDTEESFLVGEDDEQILL